MLLCHHFQSLASRPNFFPDAGVTKVESCIANISKVLHACARDRKSYQTHTKSNAAILCLILPADGTVAEAL